jgi:AcrR family transcriptional regulator
MGRPQTISNEDMLAAAREVFLKHGVFGSTKEIARHAGISEAALFKRFSTKAQLFMAAMAPPTPGIEGIIERAAAMKSAREALHVLSEAVLDYFRTAIPMILPLVSHPTFGAPELPRNFETSAATGLLRAIATYLVQENARGRLRVKDPLAASAMLVSSLHSIALFEIMGFHGGTMPKAGIRSLVDALWHGLEPTPLVSKRKRKSR